MSFFIKYLMNNKDWIFSGVGLFLIGGLVKIIFSRKKDKDISKSSYSNNSLKGNGNIVGNGNVGGNCFQGNYNYIAEQTVILAKQDEEKNKKGKTWFSARYNIFQGLMNATRVSSEKEYTTEYISFLLGLSNVSELIRFIEGNEEPDNSFKKKFVDVFGVNEDWILFNRGDNPFASNQKFSGDDPMDILRKKPLNNIKNFILIIGEIEGKKHVLVVEKYSEVHYEVIPKAFVFYPEVGARGESILVSLYRFVREATKIKKLYEIVYCANEKEFADILKGAVPAKNALRFRIDPNFADKLLDLNNEIYEVKQLDKDLIKIKSIIKKRIEEIDKINQAVDKEEIYKNLGTVGNMENDINMFSDTTAFFAYRFGKAFPGVRGTKVFDNPKEAVDRLEILLKNPLSSSQLSDPIWEFRGISNMAIERFIRVADDKFLMGPYEIKIKRIIAYSSTFYFKNFVYVETVPEEQTGLYDRISLEELKECSDKNSIRIEEYAVFADKMITRAEYDDGAAVIDGQPVDVAGKAKLRVRYLTPYNFLIGAKFNPINDNEYDFRMKEVMDSLLKNKEDFNTLKEWVEGMHGKIGIYL